MEPDFFARLLTEYGPLALGWPLFFWAMRDNVKLRDRLFEVIESNTRLLGKLTGRGDME